MERKDGKKNLKIVKTRISEDLYARILAAKEPAGFEEEAEATFIRHLIVLGIKEVDMAIEDKKRRDEKGDRRGEKKASSE
jgi:hypothetical protein